MAPAARPPISTAIAVFHNDGEQEGYYEDDNSSMTTVPLLQHYGSDNISMGCKKIDPFGRVRLHGVGNHGYYCLACLAGSESCRRLGRRPRDKARYCLGSWFCRGSKGTRCRYDKERGSPPQRGKWRLFWRQHHSGVSTMLDWIVVSMDRMRCSQRKQRYEELLIISPLASSLHHARTSTKNRTRVV